MQYKGRKHVILPEVILLFAILFLIAGCASHTIKPDYENTLYQSEESKRDNAKLIVVVDKRNKKENFIGFHTGPPHFISGQEHLLSETVASFVEKSLRKIIENNTTGEKINPITVYIDTFSIVHDPIEYSYDLEKNFKCALRFYYPAKKDSFEEVKTSFKKFPGRDTLENLLYEAICNCSKSFIEYYDKTAKYYIPNIYPIPEDYVWGNSPLLVEHLRQKDSTQYLLLEKSRIESDSLSENSYKDTSKIRSEKYRYPIIKILSGQKDSARDTLIKTAQRRSVLSTLTQPKETRFASSLGFSTAIIPVGITGSANLLTLNNLLGFGVDGTILAFPTDSIYLDAITGIYFTLSPVRSEESRVLYLKAGIYRLIPLNYTQTPTTAKSFGIGGESHSCSEDGSCNTYFLEIMMHYLGTLEEESSDIWEWFPILTWGKRF